MFNFSMFFFHVFGGSLENHIPIPMFRTVTGMNVRHIYLKKNEESEQQRVPLKYYCFYYTLVGLEDEASS